MAKRLLRLGLSVSFLALLAAAPNTILSPPDPESTLNAADKHADIALSGGNLTATLNTTSPSGAFNVRGTSYGPTSTGKYFEVTFNNLVTGQARSAGFGIASKVQSLTIRPGDQVGAYATQTMPTDKFGITYCPATGYAKWPGSAAATWATGSASDIYGVLVTGTGVVFTKNGTIIGTTTTLPAQRLFPIISLANNGDSVTVNFGKTPFSFKPSSAVAWNGTPTHTPFPAILQHPEKIGAVICCEVNNTYYFNHPMFGDWFEYPYNTQTILDGINNIGFHHYQTQVPAPIPGNPGNVKFYPAAYSAIGQTSADLALMNAGAQASGNNIILGYNEPWNFGGALTPQLALDSWPSLMALGPRLASPSISGPTDGTAWLDQFMAGVASNGYRVDVINVHYYANLNAGSSVNTFRQYLIDIHNRYGKNIIVTEWACDEWSDNGISTDVRQYSGAFRNPTFTLQQQADYVRDALVMLDSLDFVEFHTYWEAVDGNGWYYNTPILWSDGTPTIIGQVFKEAIALAAVGSGGTGPTEPVTTLNSADKYSDIVLSGNDLTATYTTSNSPGNKNVRATKAGVAGRYFEVHIDSAVTTGSTLGVGLANLSQSLTSYPGSPNGAGWFASGYAEWPGSGFSGNFGGYNSGVTIGVYLKASSIEFTKDGTLVGTVTGLPTGDLYPIFSPANNGDAATFNFGATPFAHKPSDAVAWDGDSTSGTWVKTPVTWNPTDHSAGTLLSNNNLTADFIAGQVSGICRATLSGGAGDYCEITIGGSNSSSTLAIGVSNASQDLNESTGKFGNPNGVIYFNGGYVEWPGGNNFGQTQAPVFTVGDVMGMLPTATTLKFFKNGAFAYEAPALPSGALFPTIGTYSAGFTGTANFGATTFQSLPAGAQAWDTDSPLVFVPASTPPSNSGTPRFVCDGDSLTYGLGGGGVGATTPYPTQLTTISGLTAVNLGVGGKKLIDMDTDYATHTAPNYVAGRPNHLIFIAGINDCYNGGTVSGMNAAIRSYCAKARATGFKVYIATMTPSVGYGWNSTMEAVRTAVNTDRRNNWATYADGFLDLDAAFPSATNLTYYQSEGLHWTTETNACVAAMVWAAITTVVNPNKIGAGAWGEWLDANGNPVTGDPNNPMPSQVALDGLNAIGFKFYQTWHPQKLTGNQGNVNFIPGWWNSGDGDGELTTANLALMQADGDLIIGSNEPWNTFGQPNFGLSPAQALAVWPKLLALGNRLASPSISGTDGWDWLQQFMAGCASNGYRVDVINVHYYMQNGGQDINSFRNYLQSVYDTYGKPIIVTEWGLYANWNLVGDINNPQVPFGAQAAWAVAGAKMMDSLSFIEKHFWYAESTGAGGTMYLGSEAIHNDGTLTPVGYAFRQLLKRT